MAALSPTAQVLYILSVLRHQGILTVREKNLLKGMLLRRDERVFKVATHSTPDASVFEEVPAMLRGLAVEEALQRYTLVRQVFDSESEEFLQQAKRERATLGGDASLLHGEIGFEAFVRVLQQVSIPPRAKFVDLGSGCGMAVLAASLLFDFDELHGVEKLKSLYDASLSVLGTFRKLESDMHELPDDAVPISFHRDDLLSWDWRWADVVFANSTCYSDELVAGIAEKAALLRPGSLVITVTQRLVHPTLKLIGKSKQSMSWGDATYYIHRRQERAATDTRQKPSLALSPSPSPTEGMAVMQSMSSPQGAALLEAKRRRRAAAAASRASSNGRGERRVGKSSHPARLQFSPTLRMEMDTGFRPSSPQGDALLARKKRHFQRPPTSSFES